MARQPTPRFRVTIHYREPLYAETRGIPVRTHTGSFDVVAVSEDIAVMRAILKFEEAAALSSVGWKREIVSITCELQSDAQGA